MRCWNLCSGSPMFHRTLLSPPPDHAIPYLSGHIPDIPVSIPLSPHRQARCHFPHTQPISCRNPAILHPGEKIVSNTASLSDGITTVNAALENTNALALRISGTADEMRTILANLYLEVRGINENTSMLVKYGRGMNENIEKIKENTKNL